MKNLILSFILCFGVVLGANAQTELVSRYSKPLDTITNTGVKTLTNKIAVKGANQSVTVSVVALKLTGTAAGTVILQGSLDGVNFDRIRSANLIGGGVDSLLITNVATPQVKHWAVVNSPYLFYRTQTTGVGTSTFTIAGKYLAH